MIGKQCIGRQRDDGGNTSSSWIVLYLALILAAFVLNGCSDCDDDCDDPLPVYVADITSDIEADGDIGVTLDDTYTVSSAQDMGNVLAGVDPLSGEEFRGFLDFPLRGVDGIPWGAVIESATLEIYISDMSDSAPDQIFPFLIDMVAFQPPMLITDDFNRVVQPPLLTMPVDFYPSDVGNFVSIDVTALMDEAQMEGLQDLQLRFLLDFSANSGLIEIDDNEFDTAPLLTVSYF